MIKSDIAGAQQAFLVTADQLSGKTPFDSLQLAQLQAVIQAGVMPPPRYLSLHWNASLSQKDIRTISSWIDEQPGDAEPKP